jgi:hypothetical protein
MAHFLDGMEGLGIESLYQVDYIADLPTCDNGEHDLHLTTAAMPIDAGDSVSILLQPLNQLGGITPGDDSYEYDAEAQFLGDGDAYVIAHRKAAGVRDIAGRIGQVLHDLTHSQKPDQYLKETDNGSKVLEPSRHENHSDRTQTDINDSGNEDQKGHDQQGIQSAE